VNNSVPVVGLALVAVNGDFLRWGSTVRAWSLGAAFAVVTWVAMRDLVSSPSRRSLLFAIIASVPAVHTTYQNAVLVVAFAAAAAVEIARSGRWREALAPIGVVAVAGASMLPYVATLSRRAAWLDVSQRPVDLVQLVAKFSEGLLASGPLAAVAWGLALSLAVTRRGHSAYGILTMVFSTLGLFAFYWSVGYPTQAWYYLALTAAIAVAIDAAISATSNRIWRIARLCVAAAVLATGFAPALSRVNEPFTNVDAIGRHLMANAQRGDLIIVSPWYVGVSLHRYYTGEARVMAIPPGVDARVHHFDQVRAAMQVSDALRPAHEAIQSTLQAGYRVWAVGGIAEAPPGVATTLPLPPLPRSGWNAGPYEVAWNFATGNLLRDHAIERIASPRFGPPGVMESVDLVSFRGWR
jgi:hypothetical protein